ncbi:MAG: BglII/BstYI family type II restriction endonuclease [Clostridium sp.]
MNYRVHSFRNGLTIFENDPNYIYLWNEVQDVLSNITDEDIINEYNDSGRSSKKSISDAINKLIDRRLHNNFGWHRQSPIFNDSEYRPTSRSHWWTLDFAKGEVAIEVAFNHGEAVAWNLIKPVLSGELNHVEKAIQTSAGIIICATHSMKLAGNFDGSVGTYEKFLQYLNPFRNILTVPMVIIGLEQPQTFKIDKKSKEVEML